MNNRQKLVIIPGWSNAGNKMWKHQLPYLQEHYDVETIVVSNKTTVSEMADEVLRRAPDTFLLLGHSLGGLIAQNVALKAPHRVKRLMLVGTFPGNTPAEQRAFFETSMLKPLLDGSIAQHWEQLNKACVAPTRENDQDLLQELLECQGLSVEGLINQTRVLMDARDISNQLSALTMPTLILYGRQDQFFSLEMQHLMMEKLPNAQLSIIEECGHLPPLEQPEMVSHLLTQWLESNRESNLIDKKEKQQ